MKYKIILIFCATIITGQKTSSPLFSSFKGYQKAKSKTFFNIEWISAGPVLNSAQVGAIQARSEQPDFYSFHLISPQQIIIKEWPS
jgi:hypothetical protein|tara:strand:+ start:2881 stop:3138 length:258 start_codon:yes stop_codon:yes gene_type:complete